MIHYLAIDPGEKTTGWAKFNADGELMDMGKVNGIDEFLDWLEELDPQPEEVILEEYRVNPTINHGFSEVSTLQLIGAIRRHCSKRSIPVHKQSNTVLKVALRHIGMYGMYYHVAGAKAGKRIKHVDDHISAYAHGAYWLNKNKKGSRKNG